MSMTVILPTRVEQVTVVAPVINKPVVAEKPAPIKQTEPTQPKELDNGK